MSLTAQPALGIRPRLTAQLAQTTRLLQLSTAELAALIESELAQNPALEIAAASHCLTCGRRLKTLACPICDRRPASADEPLVYLSTRSTYARDADFADEINLCSVETLADYVRRQIAPALSNDDQPIADFLLSSLDEHGFLPETPEICAEILTASRERVRQVLRLIQHADPIGVGARDVRESVLIQLDSLNGPEADRALARTLIADHWEQLGHHQLKSLARQLHVTPGHIEAAAEFIRRNLTPYPAQTDWRTRRGQPTEAAYREPDAIIHPPDNGDGPLSIELFSPVAGWLRVNEAFKAAVGDGALTDRARLIDCVDRAELLVRGLQHRTNTLQRLLAAMAREQAAYLTGMDRALHPLTRAQLAKQLNVHESTISRAVTDKLIALPNGRVVPLDHFFDHSLAARQALKAIVGEEAHPLTDDELARQLAQHGHVVARRTVAKYRDIEHIPPAIERAR